MSDRDRYNILLDTLRSDIDERPSETVKDTTTVIDDKTDFDRMTDDTIVISERPVTYSNVSQS
jgi:hypothetical protein